MAEDWTGWRFLKTHYKAIVFTDFNHSWSFVIYHLMFCFLTLQNIVQHMQECLLNQLRRHGSIFPVITLTARITHHTSRLILTVAKLLAGMFCFLSSPLSFCSCKEASCTETRFKISYNNQQITFRSLAVHLPSNNNLTLYLASR